MRRRKFIIGTGALAAGSAAAVGSGAFTSVSAARSVNVAVTGDDSALLALQSCNGPNGAYADIGDDGQFELNIPDLNPNAFTRLDNVFTITNQGTQSVVVYIEESGVNTAAADIGVREAQLNTNVDLPDEEPGPGGDGIYGEDVFDVSNPSEPGYGSLGIKLDEGKSIKLGVYVDTSDSNVNDGVDPDGGPSLMADDVIWNSLTIYADAEAADAGEYQFVETDSSTQ